MKIPSISLLDSVYSRLGISQLVTDVGSLPQVVHDIQNLDEGMLEFAHSEALRYEGFLQARDTRQFYRLSHFNRASSRNFDVKQFFAI